MRACSVAVCRLSRSGAALAAVAAPAAPVRPPVRAPVTVWRAMR